MVLLPTKARNYWLMIASLFFYAWGEPSFVIVMLASILANYLLAIRISELGDKPLQKKIVLAAAVVINLGILL